MARKLWELTRGNMIALYREFNERLYDHPQPHVGDGWVKWWDERVKQFRFNIAKVAQRKLYLWERQNCNEHPQREDGKGDPHYLLRQFCPECQEALRQGMEK